MPDLQFEVLGAEPILDSVSPHLAFSLRLSNATSDVDIHTVILRCQIRIEPTQRRYNTKEEEGLTDLFGEPQRWSHTVRSTLWTHCHISTSGFTEELVTSLPVPCTFDFNVAATKYFDALEDGMVPLNFLFSGTIFYFGAEESLQVAQIPWEKECRFQLPVGVWKEMMHRYYPNSAWLNLRKDVFRGLYQYKRDQGLPTWEQTIEKLLKGKS